jgi:outer membrane immunogenic protein
MVIGAAVAALCGVAAPAFAQDDVYDWSGFYIGANAGGNWGDANTDTVVTAGGGVVVIPPGDLALLNAQAFNDSNNGGFTGGGQIGYNWQNGGLLLGIETDFGALALDQDNARIIPSGLLITPPVTYNISQRVSSDWMWTVRPRLGWAGGPWMAYVTGGLAMANIKVATTYSDNAGAGHAAALTNDETKTGWVAGAGAGWAFNDHWSIGAEWLYADFGSVDATATSNNGFATISTETNPRANIFRGRVDFRF